MYMHSHLRVGRFMIFKGRSDIIQKYLIWITLYFCLNTDNILHTLPLLCQYSTII